ADAHAGPDLDLPVQRRQLADQSLEQRRLARAVRPDDADLVAAIDVHGDVAQNGTAGRVRVPDGDAWRADGLLAAQLVAGRERKADLARVLPVVLGLLQAIQLLQHLAPALCLLGLLSGQVAADEVLGLLDVLLLALVFDARALEPQV